MAQFQSVEVNKEGAWNLVKAINHSLGDQTRDEAVINKVFEALWPDLETSIKAIPKSTQEPVSPTRTDGDLLEEVLTTVRRQSMILSDIQSGNNPNLKDFAISPDTGLIYTKPNESFVMYDCNSPRTPNKRLRASLVMDALLKHGPLLFEDLEVLTGLDEGGLGNTIGDMRRDDLIQKNLDKKYQITKHEAVRVCLEKR